mgnify:CR=1 FL=1
MAKFETSTTHIPKFESSDIKKIDSYKDVLLEQSYDSNLTDFQKATYNRAIEIMEYRMLDVSAHYLLANGELHKDSYNVPWKTQGNQDSLGLKIEEWNDFEITIGMDKVTFRKISSNTTRELWLSSLNWNNKSIKMDVLKILVKGSVRKSDFIVYNKETAKINQYETPESQSIKNAISDLRDDLYSLVPTLDGVDPIEYIRKDKHWSTSIKIILIDGEEKRLETETKYKYKLGFKGMREGTHRTPDREPVDTYQDNRSSIQDSYSEYLPIDEQEEDNGL